MPSYNPHFDCVPALSKISAVPRIVRGPNYIDIESFQTVTDSTQ